MSKVLFLLLFYAIKLHIYTFQPNIPYLWYAI